VNVTLEFESSYDFDIADIASEIAKLNSDEQGVFLKMLVSFIHHYCENEPCKIANQTMYIAKEIDQRTFQWMNELVRDYREFQEKKLRTNK